MRLVHFIFLTLLLIVPSYVLASKSTEKEDPSSKHQSKRQKVSKEVEAEPEIKKSDSKKSTGYVPFQPDQIKQYFNEADTSQDIP